MYYPHRRRYSYDQRFQIVAPPGKAGLPEERHRSPRRDQRIDLPEIPGQRGWADGCVATDLRRAKRRCRRHLQFQAVVSYNMLTAINNSPTLALSRTLQFRLSDPLGTFLMSLQGKRGANVNIPESCYFGSCYKYGAWPCTFSFTLGLISKRRL